MVFGAPVLFACGGAQKQELASPAAAAPMHAEATQAQRAPSENPSAPGAAAQPATPSTHTADAFPSQARLQASRATAVDNGLVMVEQANDCGTACRALSSMDHACGELCAAAMDADERSLCARSSDRVRRAREKVKHACRSCPGGTSVEPSDPIPSRP